MDNKLEYQIEILRKHLGEKVKGVHLGSSYEVRDPITRVFDKKPIKPFLVNQLTLMLERGQIRIPHREIDETFHRQMTNYVVERVSTQSGIPTYSSTDEHALDGLMFTVFAFIENYPDLVKTVVQKAAATAWGFVKTVHQDPVRNIYQQKQHKEELRQVPKRQSSQRRGRTESLGWGQRGSSKSFSGRSSW
jgi:hypothetical protein